MATITSLGFSIFARERATRVFRRIGDSAEQMAERAQRAGRAMAEGFQKLDGAMTAAGATAGVALGAAMAKTLDASAATAKLTAQLGLTAEQSQRFGRMAGRLYSQAYGESIEEVHGAIGAVVSSIDGMRNASDAAVEGMARKALTLAKVFEIDTARSIQVVGQIVKTGLVKDATEGMDLLTAALQRVPAAVREDLLDALDEYGPFMEQIGIKGSRAFEILIQAADKGAFGLDKAGDAFKEITLKIASSAPAVDAALKQIGMTQAGVQDAFARGGVTAQQAFQKIVGGLLKIPDPGKRAETAIALFGTPIEDLNTKDIPAFLQSLTKTSGQLRDTAGAADRAGQAVQDAAGTKLESFKRSVEQNLSQVIAEDVIPKLEQLSRTAKGVGVTPSGVANAIITLGAVALGYKSIAFAAKLATFQVGRFSVVKGVQGGAAALAGLAAGFRNVNLAMAANATLSTRLGAALRSQIMLWRQQAAAAGVSTARIILNAAAQKIAAAATRLWAIAQGIFNAVMSANPIALVIIAIAALVAAIVIAYKKSETFRKIVDAAWAGIKTAVAAAWDFIRPVFFQIVHVLRNVIGKALQWYWAYTKFVWGTVWTIIQTVWGFLKPIFQAIADVVRGVLSRAFTFFQNIAKIVWIAIQIYIKIAWGIIKTIFAAMKFYVTKILAPTFKWLWKNVIVPAWNGIKGAIKVAWGIIKGVFNAVRSVIRGVLAPIFQWLWSNVIRPLWNKIKNHISNVWNGGIKPAFDKIKSGVRAVRNAFSTAVDGIRKIWGKIKDYAKKPVNFVIGTVYNRGIVGLVNKIANFAGVKTRLSPIKLLERGGTLDNPARVAPMKVNRPTAIVGEGNRCIARGTLIETAAGLQPIEDVHPGERVRTRSGWMLVSWSGLTRPDAEVLRLSTASGHEVVCTPDHRIWTARGTGDGDGRGTGLGGGALRGRGVVPYREDALREPSPGNEFGDDRPGRGGEVSADRGFQPSEGPDSPCAGAEAHVHAGDREAIGCEAADPGFSAMVRGAAYGQGPGSTGADRGAGCGCGVPGEVLQARAPLDAGEHLHEPARHPGLPSVQEGPWPRMDAPEACWREARELSEGDWVWVLVDGELCASRVTAIVPAERIDTYDLTVEHEHEFVAGGILVHNSYPEYVIPTDPRFRDRALSLWAQAGQDLAGRSAPGKRMGGEGLMFERGGIIGKFLGGLKSFAFDKPTEMFKSTVDKLVGQIPGKGVFRDAVAGVPKKLAGSLVQWFKDKVGFGGGKGVGKAMQFAKAQAGKPYVWGGVGPRGFDCSGLWSSIVNVIKGRNPYSRLFTTFSFTGGMNGPEGFRRNLRSGVRVGVTNAGVGHMAGTLGRTAVESSGSAGVRVGGGARGADDRMFTMRYGLKADTGAATLAPGWNPVYNGTGKAEYLETPRRGHDGPLVNIEKVEVHDRADVDLLADHLGFRVRAQAFA